MHSGRSLRWVWLVWLLPGRKQDEANKSRRWQKSRNKSEEMWSFQNKNQEMKVNLGRSCVDVREECGIVGKQSQIITFKWKMITDIMLIFDWILFGINLGIIPRALPVKVRVSGCWTSCLQIKRWGHININKPKTRFFFFYYERVLQCTLHFLSWLSADVCSDWFRGETQCRIILHPDGWFYSVKIRFVFKNFKTKIVKFLRLNRKRNHRSGGQLLTVLGSVCVCVCAPQNKAELMTGGMR